MKNFYNSETNFFIFVQLLWKSILASPHLVVRTVIVVKWTIKPSVLVCLTTLVLHLPADLNALLTRTVAPVRHVWINTALILALEHVAWTLCVMLLITILFVAALRSWREIHSQDVSVSVSRNYVQLVFLWNFMCQLGLSFFLNKKANKFCSYWRYSLCFKKIKQEWSHCLSSRMFIPVSKLLPFSWAKDDELCLNYYQNIRRFWKKFYGVSW